MTAPPIHPCEWAEDDEGAWDTQCGERFIFSADGPTENGMHYCCYCGRPLVEVKYVEKEQ